MSNNYIMSKLKCIDCGTIFESTMDSCPTCGCPAKNCEVVKGPTTKSEKITDDGSVASTEETEVLFESARSILKWGRIFAFMLSGIVAISFIYYSVMFFNYGSNGAGIFMFCLGILFAVLLYNLVHFLCKVCWATMRKYANMYKILRNINEK